MRVIIILTLILLSCFITPVVAQKNKAVQSTSILGEYRDESESGSLTFNIERNKRTRKYRLWVGTMGTSAMNYHEADAANLRINARMGTLSFSYTYGDGEQCSFVGTVKGGKIRGQLDCTDNGRRESKRVILKRFRRFAT